MVGYFESFEKVVQQRLEFTKDLIVIYSTQNSDKLYLEFISMLKRSVDLKAIENFINNTMTYAHEHIKSNATLRILLLCNR